MPKSLYICYFGVREPLVQTQVLPYLREILKDGIEISLLTFEPDAISDEEAKTVRAELDATGIKWHWLRYHKRPSALATAYDIFRGAWFVRNAIRRDKLDILHGRVHVPTLMGALGRKLSGHRPKLLFDIRGFFPEEYTDAGIWPAGGWLYRSAKRVERWLLREADGFVVLTARARDILFAESRESGYDKAGRPVEIIPCCVDLSRFQTANSDSRTRVRNELGLDGRYVTAYIGAFGGWYLTKETADFFGELKARRKDAFALILTQSNPEVIEPLLRERGYDSNDYLVTRVKPAEIPYYLSGADAAVSFIKNCYSKQASSPTKNAEYLACGLPIIANLGVGDVDDLITNNNVGILVHDFDPESYNLALDAIEKLGDIKERCQETVKREFDLRSVGGERYRRIYRRLLEK